MGGRRKRIVVSLGGSLMVPEEVDVAFLARFSAALRDLAAEGHSFIVIPGGGSVARRYQSALREVSPDAPAAAGDVLGIRALALNAEFLHAMFADIAFPHVITDNRTLPEGTHAVLIAAGAQPGRSSDAGAVELAVAAGESSLVNLSDIAGVFSADPRVHVEAERYSNLSWSAYRALIPSAWDPGLRTPFDPVASRMAQEAGLTVAILSGHDMGALAAFVRTGECRGTLIHP